MIEFAVILSLAMLGAIVRSATGWGLARMARASRPETIAAGPGGDWRSPVVRPVEPVLRFGSILACDGAIVLALVSALPGAFALERTGLAFAVLSVGGLVGEIASTGTGDDSGDDSGNDAEFAGDFAADAAAADRRRISKRLSVALTVMLNLSFAVLTTGQGLIEIVPPKSVAAIEQQLEPVIVLAERTYDPLDESTSGDGIFLGR